MARLAVAEHAGWQRRVPHVVAVERKREFVAAGHADHVPGTRWNELLRLDAGDEHVGRVADVGREQALDHELGVALELHALEAPAHLVDDPEEAHRVVAPGGVGHFDDDQVVELHLGAVGDAEPELQRGGVLGAEHHADARGPRGLGFVADFAAGVGVRRSLGGIGHGRPPGALASGAAAARRER